MRLRRTPEAAGARAARREIPDFLVKTTLGCSVICCLMLIPFTVNNFLQGRIPMGLATSTVALGCVVNIALGLRGKYSLAVNTYLICPSGAATITYTMIRLAQIGSYWPFLLVLAFYFVLPQRRAWIFNALALVVFTPVAWTVLDRPSAVRFSASLVGSSLFALFSMREINLLHRLLKEQAVRDTLTGLFNRSLLQDSVERAVELNRRAGRPMVLIGFDIDHFKAINDAFGHDSGDEVLRGLGELLSRHIRRTDRCFRIGGEEFLVLIHDTDERRGAEIAEKVRRDVEQAAFLPGRNVTISAGVSGLSPGMDGAAWTKSCDEKLYHAKERGRNRVVV